MSKTVRGGSDAVRVLHVDDEPDFTELSASFLEREADRFTVETASSASEGLDRLTETAFDCIVSDYEMPGRDGIEFLETVREEYPDLPFILFTGKGSEEVASEAISVGVTDYLQKETGTDQYAVLANRIRNAVERRRVEQDHKRQLKAIETAQEGIAILDEDGRYIYVNRAFADLHGYEPEELVGEHWQLVYVAEDVPEVREEILPKVERSGYWHGETTSRRADGSTVVVDHTLATTERGELVCTVRDISDQKRRKQEIRRTRARLEALFEYSPDLINIHDLEGNIINPNPRLCEETGYDASELADMKVWDLDQNIDSEEASALWEGMAVGDSHRVEGEFLRKDGSTFPVEIHVRRLDLYGADRFVAISRDISARKQRDRRLEQAETMFEYTQDAVFLIDVDDGAYTVERVNPAYERATGLESHEVRGRTPREILGDEVGSEVEGRYQTSIDRDEPIRYEEELPIDGEPTHWETQIAPITVDGEVEQLVGATREITDRKQRNRRLEQYETIVETSGDIAFVVDNEWRVDLVDRTISEYVDAPLDDLEGNHVMQLAEQYVATDDDPSRLRDALERAFRSEPGAGSGERLELTLNFDGETRIFEYQISPVAPDDDDPTAVVVTMREMTERRRYQRELERTRDRIEFVLRQTDSVVWEREPEADELTTYPDPCPLLGRSVETVEDFRETVHPEDRSRVAAAVETAIETGESEQTEYRTVADVEPEWIRIRIEPVKEDGEVSLLTGINRDITEQKRRALRLEQQNERFDELASAVSHDLQTPLSTARGYAELALDADDATEQIENALTALKRADELREGLVEVLRSGEIVQEREHLDIGQTAAAVWETVQTSNECSLQVVDSPRLSADPNALRRLLGNLLSNAMEHGSNDVTVRVGAVDGGFYVEDDGPGIPADDRDRIFTPGFSTKDGGTGVGMASVREIVTAHDWSISVTESSLGGARFEITDDDRTQG